ASEARLQLLNRRTSAMEEIPRASKYGRARGLIFLTAAPAFARWDSIWSGSRTATPWTRTFLFRTFIGTTFRVFLSLGPSTTKRIAVFLSILLRARAG